MNTDTALQNATQSDSTSNYKAIFEGFAAMGLEDIRPRENVFTYRAWLALGRQVSKGVHGVKVVTYVPMTSKDKATGEKKEFRRPKTTTVFHISQTEPKEDGAPISIPAITERKPTPKQQNGDKFRTMADKLQKEIDNKFADRQTNTAKRLAQANSARFEGERLTRTQKALRGLADLYDSGTVPAVLAGINSKKAVYDLMAETRERAENGYHSYVVGTGKPYEETPQSLALWALLSGKTDEEKKADELKRKIEGLQFSKIPGYFPTPKAVIDLMLDHADLRDYHKVLEPSAGSGAICDAVADILSDDGSIDCIEQNYTLADILKAKGYAPTQGDFMLTEFSHQFDRVVMNPPFEQLQDIDHVLRAFDMLKDGGRLVSVMSPSPFFHSCKKAEAFRQRFDELGGEKIDLPTGSFKESGTGVASILVVLDK